MVPKDLYKYYWQLQGLVAYLIQGQITKSTTPDLRGFAAVGFAAIAFTQLHVVAGGDTWDETSWSTSTLKAVTTNSLPVKIDGWKVKIPCEMAPFWGTCSIFLGVVIFSISMIALCLE